MEINEVLMKRGMFLTFWLRTKNDYFNVKSKLTETAVFKKEIKTEFVRNQDEVISGGFSTGVSTIQYGPYCMVHTLVTILYCQFLPIYSPH